MKIILMICALLFTISCTQHKEESSKISIDLSQITKSNSSLSLNPIALILNVSSPRNDFIPIFEEGDCKKTACTAISADVPSGSDRRIQVILVGTKTGESIARIYYGHSIQNLEGGDANIHINMSEIANFQNETKWGGRYIPKNTHSLSGHYLTGKISTFIKPQADHPPMKIIEDEVFGGWFRTMLLDTVKFKFVFSGWDQNGNFYAAEEIFNDLHDGSGLNSSSVGVQFNADKILHFHASGVYEEEDGAFTADSPMSNKIVGFFGGNPDGRYLCSKHIDPTSSFQFDGGTDSSGTKTVQRSKLCKVLGAGGTCSTYANWPADVMVTGSFNHCPSPVAAQWPIDHRILEEREKFFGFRGPFNRDMTVAENQDEPFYTAAASPGVIQWHLAPNAYIAGVEVFSRVGQGNLNRDDIKGKHDFYDCGKLSSNGFVSRGVASNSYSLSAQELSPDVQFAFCPVTSFGSYFGTAAISESSAVNGPQSLEFLVLDSSGNPVGGGAFSSSIDYEFPPTEKLASETAYIVIRNNQTEPVDVGNININMDPTEAGFTLGDARPGSGTYSVAGTSPFCGVGNTLDDLQPNQHCVVQINFSPVSGPNSAITFYDKISVDLIGDITGQNYHADINIVAPIPFVISSLTNITGTAPDLLGQLHLDAPSGKESTLFLKLKRTGTDISYDNIDRTSVTPDFSVELDSSGNSCPSSGPHTLSAGQHCYIKIAYIPDSGPITGSFSFTNLSIGSSASPTIALNGSSAFNVVHAPSTPITGSSPGEYFYDFGNIDGVTRNFIMQNNAPASKEITFFDSFNIGNAPFSLGSTTCGPLSSSNVTLNPGTCDFDVNLGSAPNHVFGNVFIPYKVNHSTNTSSGTTYRAANIILEAR